MDTIYRGAEARKLILDGAKELFEAVKVTYGPTSGNVGILKRNQPLKTTHDGATAAKNIELKGALRAGAEIIKNATDKMERELGDGTTTVTALSFGIIEEVQDSLMLGASPIKLFQALKKDADIAVKLLPDFVSDSPVTLDILKQVGGISASDLELGAKIAEVVWEVGVDGNVTVDYSLLPMVTSKIAEGYTFDSGMASNYMIKDTTKLETILENPKILIVNKKIDNQADILEVIKVQGKSPLLIIANSIADSVLSTIIGTNLKGLTDVIFVKSPRYGNKRVEYLNDIAAVVGTKVVDGTKVGFDTPLGEAARVITSLDKTVIVDGSGDTTTRKGEIKLQIQAASDDFEKEEAEKRFAQVEGKVAVISVGGMSDDEVNEKKDRVDDAVFACQAALRGNVVAGGGTTLIDIANQLPEGSILRDVLRKPYEILMRNVGLSPDEFEVGGGKGVNLRTGKVVDLFKEGIIEPAETVQKAIEYAVSIAGTAITTEVLIVEEDEDDE
jgi:chaperonin GroEL